MKVRKKRTQAMGLDILLWIYLAGCLTYLINKWLLPDVEIWYYALFAWIPAVILNLIGHSPGCRYILGKNGTPWFRSVGWWTLTLSIVLTFVVGWVIVEINPYKLFTRAGNATHIVSGIFHPNFKLMLPLLKALAETIYLAFLATVLAIPFAFGLSFLASRNLMPRTWLGNSIYMLIRTIATIFRSVEAIVWAIIFSVWVGIGPFAGMLALMIHSIAALTKLYSEQIENIDPGPVEAIKATGAGGFWVWWYAVIPQILSPFLAFTIYRWDINVRMATIVGFVGGGGIGLALQQQQQMLAWQNVGVIIWLIALTVWLMDLVSGKVRAKLLDI